MTAHPIAFDPDDTTKGVDHPCVYVDRPLGRSPAGYKLYRVFCLTCVRVVHAGTAHPKARKGEHYRALQAARLAARQVTPEARK